MAVEPRSLDRLEYRLDHKTLGDVRKVRIERGKITDVWSYYDDPFIPLGLVDVEVEGTTWRQVPLFYHSRKDWPEADNFPGGDRLNQWGALENAAWAFRCDQYVKVMFYEEAPIYVIGHDQPQVYYKNDPREPRPCNDILRFQWKIWFQTTGWQTVHLRMGDPTKTWKKLNETAVDLQGKPVPLPHRAKRLYGLKERLMFTTMWYSGDWLVVVGPVAYIFQVYTVGLPLPVTAQLIVEAGVWTAEREEAWLAVGREREDAANRGVYQSGIATDIPYPDVVYQSQLSDVFNQLFVGFPAPSGGPEYWARWVFSEFWFYDSERAASDPNAPNTPNG